MIIEDKLYIQSFIADLFGASVTTAHLLLCLIVTYGSLFSRTPFQAYSVLCCLVTMFLMIRKFNCCILTPLENSELTLKTTKIGRSFLIKNFGKISLTEFEEITVGNALLIHIIKMALILIIPHNLLYDK
jgi:hypothetical protein